MFLFGKNFPKVPHSSICEIFFFFLVISHIPTISQDLHWQWVFLLAGKFHIIQKGKLLVKKLETEADFGMYQEAVVDSLFLVLM